MAKEASEALSRLIGGSPPNRGRKCNGRPFANGVGEVIE